MALTHITLPGTQWIGYADYEERSDEDMIARAREQATREWDSAMRVLTADDAEFQIVRYPDAR